MKPSGFAPAIQLAVAFIEKNVADGTWQAGERLPPIRTLAHMAEVSTATMCKAIALLKAKKVVSAKSRHRIHAGPSGGQTQVVPQKKAPWHAKRILFEQDILKGVFSLHSTLPSSKELQGRYGVSYRTLRKILNALQADNVIKVHGKGYVLSGVDTKETHQRILFITDVGHFSQTSAINQQHNRIVNIFETECIRLGLRLEILEIDFYDSLIGKQAITALKDTNDLTGFILDVWWYPSNVLRQTYMDLLHRLTTFNKPVAILDELGDFVLPVQFVKHQAMQVYSIEGKNAGARMARYLMNLGHRTVVYASHVHHDQWSRDRYDGIAEQFARAGCNGLHLAAIEITEGIFGLLSASELDLDDIKGIAYMGHTEAQKSDMEEQLKRFKQNHTQSKITDGAIKAEIRRTLEPLIPLLKQGVHDSVFSEMCQGALNGMLWRAFDCYLEPLFIKAIQFRNATAWICANDLIAFSALKFLKKNNIKVPHDISIVGFDNTPARAIKERLTTFDFNVMSFTSHILNFIVRPPRQRGGYRHATIEIEGIVVERSTACQVNAAASPPAPSPHRRGV